MFGSFYPTARNADELIELVGLSEEGADASVVNLSAGEAAARGRGRAGRRPGLCSSSTSPTTGLDPQSRRQLWDVIRELTEPRPDDPL